MQAIIDKYKPKSLDEVVSNKKAIEEIRAWAKDYKKPLFIYGDTGIGKTLSANLIANEMNWSIYKTDASNVRNKETIQNLMTIATTSTTLFGKKRVIILDEIDALDDKRGGGDSGGFTEISKIIDKTKQPIIFIANEVYKNKKLRPIFEKSEKIKFNLPNKISILKFVKNICDKENIDYDLMALKELVEHSKNDVRATLLDLDTLSLNKNITIEQVNELGDRKKDEDIFKILGTIFYSSDFYKIKNTINNMDIDWKLLFVWLEENVPRKYKEFTNLERGMEALSMADLYQGRIGINKWILLKYVFDYLTIGVAYAKQEREKGGFAPFVFPSILKKLSGNKKERNIKLEIVKKIKKNVHCSKHIIERDYLPILSIIASTNTQTEKLIKDYEFSLEEIKLLGAKITKKNYEKIILKD